MEGDSDSWSEPDKAASRARMGLREDCGVGSSSKHRTTETEATELRRERGRVDRLRLEVKIEQEEGRPAGPVGVHGSGWRSVWRGAGCWRSKWAGARCPP